MDRKVLLAIFIALPLLSYLVSAGLTFSSTGRQFVANDTLFINWTNSYESNIVISINDTAVAAGQTQVATLNVTLHNKTGITSHNIGINYSQPSTGWLKGSYATQCFNTGSDSNNPLQIFVKNVSDGAWTMNTTQLGAGSMNNVTTMALFFAKRFDCPPGRYRGTIMVSNSTNTAENFNVSVTVDIPIHFQNELNNITGVAQFRGNISGNSNYYHSYFFNTTGLPNATAFAVNLTWNDVTNKDIDMFLLDSSQALLARSTRNGSSEGLHYTPLVVPSNQIYEIRVYGNFSVTDNYTGYVIYSTINATIPVSSTINKTAALSLGTRNYTQNASHIENITIRNQGNITASTLRETKELYFVNRTQGAAPTAAINHTFVVPDFVAKVRVELNWTGAAVYALTLYRSNHTLLSNISDKSNISNFTNVSQFEFLEYLPSGGSIGNTDDGLWTIGVTNRTFSTSAYTVTIKQYVNPSSWITSNFTSFSIGRIGQTNETQTYQYNVTVQQQSLSSLMEGSVVLTTDYGANVTIPIELNVSTASLLVNNTYNKRTLTVADQIGFNRSYGFNGPRVLNITINNTGANNLSLTHLNSTALHLIGNNSAFVNVTYNVPLAPLGPGSSGMVNITLIINTTNADQAGIYRGWIFLNATDTSPYKGFNLTLDVNISSALNVFVRDVQGPSGTNVIFNNAGGGIPTTVFAQVYLFNETVFTDTNDLEDLSLENFTGLRLVEGNMSFRVPATGNLTISSGFSPIHGTSRYRINFTVPQRTPGGIYTVNLDSIGYRNGQQLIGNVSNATLVVNSTGINVTVESAPGSISNGSTSVLTLRIKNFGPVSASLDATKITITKGSGISTTKANDTNDATTCASPGVDDTTITITTMGAYDTTGCTISWNLTAGSTAGTTTTYVNVTNGVSFYNATVGITVTVPSSSSSSSSSSAAAAASSTNLTSKLSQSLSPDKASVVQGQSTKFNATVENTGGYNQKDVELTLNLASGWYSVESAKRNIDSGKKETFVVVLSPPADALVKTYSITVKAANTNVSDEDTFTLNVTPSESGKAAINSTYSNYTANYTTLENRIRELASSGANVTAANATLTEIKAKLDAAQDALNRGDYFTAAVLLQEAEELFRQAESQTAESRIEGSSLVWVVVGFVVIAAGGFLIYLLLPPAQGYKTTGFQYAVAGKGSPLQKIKQALQEIKNKIQEKLKRKQKYDFSRGSSWKSE